MSTPRTAVGAALIVVVTSLTACGDDTDAIAKEDFLEQANAICETTNRELTPIFEAVWADLDEADLDERTGPRVLALRFHEAMQSVEPIALAQVEDIRALGAPDGDEDLIEALLDDQEAAIRDFADTAEAAAAGDEAAMAAMNGSEEPFDELDRRARDYGLTVCGESD